MYIVKKYYIYITITIKNNKMKLSKRQLNESIKMNSLTKGARQFNPAKFETLNRKTQRNNKYNTI